MIKRVYIKDYLNLCDIELEFDKGLNVFSGASGAGKSIFMSALLSAFGFGEAKSSLIELNVTNFILPQEFLSDDDEILLKQIKKDKTRFFLNHQSISKNKLKEQLSSKEFLYNKTKEKIQQLDKQLIYLQKQKG